jgi:hypothetical protein
MQAGRNRSTMGFAVILLPIILVVAVIAAYYAYQQQQKRRADLRLLAAQLGWQFVPDKDYAHDEEYAHYEIFRHGHSRYAYNTLFGAITVDGQPWQAKMGDFHYQITTSNGKTTTTHTYRFSYLILELPYLRVPDLLIRREGMFDAIKNLFGFDDVDFESAEFSRRFFVKSPDKRFAYDVIHAGMMEFLLAGDPPTIDVEQRHCCLSDGKRIWSPERFRATIGWAQRFFELWPRHVVCELQS